MQQYKEEIVDLVPQLKKRKLRHALDIVRKADELLSSAMDSVPEEEEFSLDLVINCLATMPSDPPFSLFSCADLLHRRFPIPKDAVPLTTLLIGAGHPER